MADVETARGTTEETTAQQIARLRSQVEALMRDRVASAVADVAGRAENAMYGAAGVVREQADALSGRVREQPLTAIVIAAAVGFLLGRTMR